MCKLENAIYLEKRVNRTLKSTKTRFQTFQRMRLTKGKKILMVQTKLEDWKRSLKVKRKTLLQSGFHWTQDYLLKPKWTTTKWTICPSADGVRSAWQAEARASSTAPVKASMQCPPLHSTTCSSPTRRSSGDKTLKVRTKR